MTQDQVRAFLLALGTPSGSVIANDKWVNAPCPLAPWRHDSGKDNNPSFGVSLTPAGNSRFHCWACESGDLLYLLQLLSKYGAKKPKYQISKAREILMAGEVDGVYVNVPEYDDKPKPEFVLWDEAWLESFAPATEVPIAMGYLNGRGLSDEMAQRLDIRWDFSKQAVCFPVRDFVGQLAGLRGRRITGNYHDYGGPHNLRNSVVWYGEHWVDWLEPLVLVESVFDVASALRVYKNIMAPLTVGMSKAKLLRIKDAFYIITLFDNGTGGDKARELCSKHLSGVTLIHLKPPVSVSDPGDMTVQQLKDTLYPVLKKFGFTN